MHLFYYIYVVGHNDFSTLNMSINLQESILHYTTAFADSVVIMYSGKKHFLPYLSHYSFIKEKNVFLFINIVL